MCCCRPSTHGIKHLDVDDDASVRIVPPVIVIVREKKGHSRKNIINRVDSGPVSVVTSCHGNGVMTPHYNLAHSHENLPTYLLWEKENQKERFG